MSINISKDWKGSTRVERRIIQKIIKLEKTPKAIQYFAEKSSRLGDYWYWFMLGTLWVSYTEYTDLNLWRGLFQSKRPNRSTSLMKPDELESLNAFPEKFGIFRAHRKGETDWLSYTIFLETAIRFAAQYKPDYIAAYTLNKSDVSAYFTRRGEFEVLCLDKSRAQFVRNIPVNYPDGIFNYGVI